MGDNARREYMLKHGPERNYPLLMAIYDEAIDKLRSPRKV